MLGRWVIQELRRQLGHGRRTRHVELLELHLPAGPGQVRHRRAAKTGEPSPPPFHLAPRAQGSVQLAVPPKLARRRRLRSPRAPRERSFLGKRSPPAPTPVCLPARPLCLCLSARSRAACAHRLIGTSTFAPAQLNRLANGDGTCHPSLAMPTKTPRPHSPVSAACRPHRLPSCGWLQKQPATGTVLMCRREVYRCRLS